MTDRPILFSAPMIRAILSGQKTQTRRVVKLPHQNPLGVWESQTIGGPNGGRLASGDTIPEQGAIWHTRTGDSIGCPYGQPGDKLWVREAHWFFQDEHDPVTGYTPPVMTTEDVEYRADGESTRHGWRPSIHMPRWASRITLNVTGVRVERLQDISEEDAAAEGTPNSLHLGGGRFATENFAHLWWSINGEGSWDANPWVWVVEFERALADETQEG